MRSGGNNFNYFPENQVNWPNLVLFKQYKGKSGQKWLLNEQASTMKRPKSVQFVVASTCRPIAKNFGRRYCKLTKFWNKCIFKIQISRCVYWSVNCLNFWYILYVYCITIISVKLWGPRLQRPRFRWTTWTIVNPALLGKIYHASQQQSTECNTCNNV